MNLRILTTLIVTAGLLPAAQSSGAAKLMKEIRTNAGQIHSTAMDIEKLSQKPDVKWTEYDERWNEIKPRAEELRMKLAQMESMRASLSTSERKEADQMKPLIARIESRTHEIRRLLEQPNVDLESAKFKMNARSLVRESRNLAQGAVSQTAAQKQS